LEVGQQPTEIYGKDLGMGLTAENVAEVYEISRKDQDEFAFESQKRAQLAIKEGKFKDQIVPVEIKSKKNTFMFTADEYPRETTIEQLENLKPVFKKDGTVTAGNACGRNDGASALTIMTRSKAEQLSLTPLAKIV